MKNRFLPILLVLFSANILLASGWQVKKGSGYFQISSQYMGSDKYYNSNGDKVNILDFSDFTMSLFGSYGVTERISVYGSFPVLRMLSIKNSMTGGEETNTGISDFTVGMKYYLGKMAGTHFSMKLSVGIPAGDNEDENFLFTGDGEWNQYLGIAAGKSLGNGFYAGADAGFSNRNEGYSDDILYNLELGYRVLDNLLLILKLNGKEPLENGSGAYLGGIAGLEANNQKYIAFGPEVLYSFTEQTGVNFALQTGTHTANVISAIVLKGGFYYKI